LAPVPVPAVCLYFPNEASELALALSIRVFCASSKFSSLPAQFLMTLCYKALPYENDNAQGLLIET